MTSSRRDPFTIRRVRQRRLEVRQVERIFKFLEEVEIPIGVDRRHRFAVPGEPHPLAAEGHLVDDRGELVARVADPM